jgi:hypothetical protein
MYRGTQVNELYNGLVLKLSCIETGIDAQLLTLSCKIQYSVCSARCWE